MQIRTRNIVSATRLVPLAVLLSLVAGSASAQAIFYKGRAIGTYGAITAAGSKHSARLADTFDIGCSGDPRDATLASASNPQPLGITAKGLKSHTVGQGLTAASDAAAEEVSVNVPGLKLKTTTAESHAEAICNADGSVTLSGGASVQSLNINDRAYSISGARNQKVEIPGVATVYVNHQSKQADEIRVNAIRIVMLNDSYPVYGDLFVAHSKAGMHCDP